MKKIKNKLLLVMLLCVCNGMLALIIGSNLAVSIESLVSFPQIDLLNPNIVRGFAWMKNGFGLQNSSTECTFQSVFPVSGIVDLNGGTLILDQDLIFKNVTVLNGLGTITGANHIVNLCSSITVLPTDTDIFDNVNLFFDGDLTIQSAATFRGTCSITGNGKRLTLSNSGALIVAASSTLAIRDLDLVGVADGKLYCTNNTSKLILDNVVLVQDGPLIFDAGSLCFRNKVTLGGMNMFVYATSLTSTIESKATLELDLGTTFSYDPPIDSKKLLEFKDDSGRLILESSTLHTTMTGMQFTNGNIVVKGQSVFESEVQATSEGVADRGITIGDGTGSNDCMLTIDNGAELYIGQGSLIYNNALQNSVLMENNVSRIRIASNARLVLLRNLLLATGQAVFEDASTYTRLRNVDLAGSTHIKGTLRRNVIDSYSSS